MSVFCAVIGTDVFEVEKPAVVTYEEILSSTDGFSDSNLLGHGTYGSVYYGLLQDQVYDFLSFPMMMVSFVSPIMFSEKCSCRNFRKLPLKR